MTKTQYNIDLTWIIIWFRDIKELTWFVDFSTYKSRANCPHFVGSSTHNWADCELKRTTCNVVETDQFAAQSQQLTNNTKMIFTDASSTQSTPLPVRQQIIYGQK